MVINLQYIHKLLYCTPESHNIICQLHFNKKVLMIFGTNFEEIFTENTKYFKSLIKITQCDPKQLFFQSTIIFHK